MNKEKAEEAMKSKAELEKDKNGIVKLLNEEKTKVIQLQNEIEKSIYLVGVERDKGIEIQRLFDEKKSKI